MVIAASVAKWAVARLSGLSHAALLLGLLLLERLAVDHLHMQAVPAGRQALLVGRRAGGSWARETEQ